MRDILAKNVQGIPDHIALAYDAWARTGGDGKVPESDRERWLSELSKLKVSPDYHHFYKRWEESFTPPGDALSPFKLKSRLLVGHGNPSATEVGLTVHHTWGVPIIPGSALKGLLAHYVDALYGPDDPSVAPWAQSQADRAPFQGITWREHRRIHRGPGEVYRALFGAPDADEDDEARAVGYPAGASAGLVVFHDALYIPGSVKDDQPFAADVLTVHQKTYYNGAGSDWPNDYDGPNPVSFLTVRPGAELLLSLSGPPDWTALAQKLLADALNDWGVGGKTSSGYGRMGRSSRVIDHRPAKESSPATAAERWKGQIDAIQKGNAEQTVPPLLAKVSESERAEVAKAIVKRLAASWVKGRGRPWATELLAASGQV